MCGVEDLVALVAPGECIVEPGTIEQWKANQTELDQSFPTDWLHYSLRYGSGRIVSGPFRLTLHNVFAPLFTTIVRMHRGIQRQAEERGCLDTPEAKDFIELGSFAFDDDEQAEEGGLWWYPQGCPDSWPIFARAGCSAFERFDLPLFDFLVGALKNEIRVNHFPRSFDKVLFVPRQKLL